MGMDVTDVQRKTEIRVVELEKIVDTHKSLICPNVGCRKKFQKILMLTDPSKEPRETYYACPHCFLKVEFVPKEEKPLLECPYYFGFMKTLQNKIPIPDDCLICPQLILCKKGKAN
jgi:hypothetical protein